MSNCNTPIETNVMGDAHTAPWLDQPLGIVKIFEPGHEKTCLMSYANNKDADQPAHPRSLISTFVVCCLDSTRSLDSIAEISRL